MAWEALDEVGVGALADRFPDEVAVAVTGLAVRSRLPMDRRIS